MTKRIKKELEMVSGSFYSLTSNDGNYYLKDNEGNIYYWNTSSDKAYEWLMYSSKEKHTCTFTQLYKFDSSKYGTVTKISNVRF